MHKMKKSQYRDGVDIKEVGTVFIPMSQGRNEFLNMILLVEGGARVVLTRYGRSIAEINLIKKKATRKSPKKGE